MLITILLSISLVVSITVNVFLYKLVNVQLKKIDKCLVWINEYETWIVDARKSLQQTYLKMKSIDDRGLFFKDDDVGFVFSELLDLLKKFNDRIQN